MVDLKFDSQNGTGAHVKSEHYIGHLCFNPRKETTCVTIDHSIGKFMLVIVFCIRRFNVPHGIARDYMFRSA